MNWDLVFILVVTVGIFIMLGADALLMDQEMNEEEEVEHKNKAQI